MISGRVVRMKAVKLCMVLWVVGVLFLSLNCFSGGIHQPMLVSGMNTDNDVEGSSSVLMMRKNLKEIIKNGNRVGDVSLEDYRPYDPTPSSKASVRPGPIEHGAPTMPYIPNPKSSPPSPSDDGSAP